MKWKMLLFAPLLLGIVIGIITTFRTAISNDGRIVGAQIRTVLEGKTGTFAARDSSRIKAYFASDGTLRGTYKSQFFSGRWWLKSDQLCLDLPGSRDDGCWNVVHLHGYHVQLFTATGEPQSNLELESGNPNKF